MCPQVSAITCNQHAQMLQSQNWTVQSPVCKQVPGRDGVLGLADKLLLICWEGGNKALEGNFPFAVDVIPDESDLYAVMQELLDQ